MGCLGCANMVSRGAMQLRVPLFRHWNRCTAGACATGAISIACVVPICFLCYYFFRYMDKSDIDVERSLNFLVVVIVVVAVLAPLEVVVAVPS